MVTREQLIAQSVDEYVKKALFDTHGYPEAQIEVRETMPRERFQGPLEKNLICPGYTFDDQGTPVEMGSDLTRRVYTIEWFVFALTPTWGKNIGHAIKFALETDWRIPLLDVTEPAPWPTIDAMVVLGVTTEEVAVDEPTSAEENMWRTAVRVEDTYFPSQAWY